MSSECAAVNCLAGKYGFIDPLSGNLVCKNCTDTKCSQCYLTDLYDEDTYQCTACNTAGWSAINKRCVIAYTS